MGVLRRAAVCAGTMGLCAFTLACSIGLAEVVRSRPPDILLVSIDSLRHDHLGCYGYAHRTTPTIDRLAASGVRFETAISTSSWTLPAHAALLTGLYDSTHGLVDNGLKLSDAQVTLAEALHDAGYQTAGFYGGPYLHPTFGFGQGFEHYQSCMTRLPDDLGDDSARAESQAETSAAHADVTGPRTVAEVTRWLGTADARPFFLFVHLWDVHYDYVAPDRYVRMFDPDYPGALDGRDLMRNPAVGAGMSARDLRHLIALYDAEIRFTDDTLAALLQAIDRRGRLRGTLVVITADHGEEFFEHGGKGHQRTLFDEVIRVPLIFSWPGHVVPGRSVPDEVRLIDVMPTLLGMAGVGRLPPMQGRDLRPLMQGSPLPARPAMSELLVDGRRMRSLRTGVFKFIAQGPGLDSGGFDLLADPGERRPISAAHPEVGTGLQNLAEVLDEAITMRERLARAQRDSDLDEEVLRRLRSLGYLDGKASGTPH